MNAAWFFRLGNMCSNLRKRFGSIHYRSSAHVGPRTRILLAGVIACSVIGGQVSTANSQSAERCEELNHFAATELPDEWERAAKKYEMSTKDVKEFEEIRRRLLDDTWLVNNDVFEAAALLTAGAKLLADTIHDVIDVVTPTKTLIKGATAKSVKLYKSLRNLRDRVDRSNSSKEERIRNQIMEALNPYHKAVAAVETFVGNLKTMNDLTTNQKQIKRMIREQLKALDKAIKRYQQSANQSEIRKTYIRVFLDNIKQDCDQFRNADIQSGQDLFSMPGTSNPFDKYLDGDSDPDEIHRANQNYTSMDKTAPIRVNPELATSVMKIISTRKKPKSHKSGNANMPTKQRAPEARRTRPRSTFSDSDPAARSQ